MKYLVSVNYTKFIFDSNTTADTFAALAKNSHYDDIGTPAEVTIEYLTDEEAAEYEKRN